MPTSDHTTSTTSRITEAAIFARVWEGENGELSPELAMHIVRVGFTEHDKARMHELAEKNNEGQLSPEEQQELDSYVKVGDLLAILPSKARKLLMQTQGQGGASGPVAH